MSDQSTTPVVTYESANRVAVITIRRREKRNAMNAAVVQGLASAFRRLQAGDDRVGVLTGEGDKAFSAGADVTESGEMWDCVPGVGVNLDKPLIAAVSGWCVGGALVMVLMCDLCVAAQGAKFMYPEAKLGGTGGLITGLAARIPHKLAMEFMLLGEAVDAERAYQAGFVNRVVSPGRHIEEAVALANRLAGMSPLVLSTLKRMVEASVLPSSAAQNMARTKLMLDAVNTSDDAKEGVLAFEQKRPPNFRGQ